MSRPRLSIELQIAAEQKNIQLIHQLLQICDILHAGLQLPPNQYYTVSDLPTDAEYEYYVRTYNYQTDTSITDSTIMFMSTIPKKQEIVEVKDAIIMAKYDGVSAAMLFTKSNQNNNTYVLKNANTRGRTIGVSISNTNILPKLEKLINHITFNITILKDLINSSEDLSNLWNKEIEILNIAIRGELILNYKQLDNSGQTLNHPAAAVAGLVNGGIELFIKEIDKLCIQFYEIAYIDIINLSDNQLYRFIPTQYQTVIMLKDCYIYYNYVNPLSIVANPQLSLDSLLYNASNTIEINFDKIYDSLISEIYYPTDGLVYCNQNWKYPQNKEEFGKVGYGKYAWKPSNKCYSFVEGIEWPLTKNGELNPIIQFTEFTFNGTKYSQCKMSMGQLFEYQKLGFGIGAELLISIVNLKTAHIDGIISPADEVYKIPVKCPYCNSQLVLENGKTNNSKHLKCRNENCIEQKVQKYAFFISSLSKLYPQLIFKNKNGKVVKSKISENTLRKIYNEHGDLNNSILLLYIPNMLSALDSLSHENQLYVLSLGGIKQIQALIKEHKTNSWKDYRIEWFK